MIGQIGKFAIQVVGIVVLSRLLSPTAFGYLAMILAIVGVANVLGDFGLSLAAIQAKTLSSAQRSNLFWLNAAVGLVTAMVVFLLAEPIAGLYGVDALVDATRALSMAFLLNGLMAQFRVHLTRQFRFATIAVGEVSSQLVGLATALVLAVAGSSYWALIAQQIAVPAVLLVWYAVSSRWLPGLPNRTGPVRALLGFSASTTAVQIINYASSNLHSLLIGRLIGAAALGYFTRAFQIFMIPIQQVASPLTRVVLPVLSRRVGSSEFPRYVLRIQATLAYGVGGALTFFAMAGQPLVRVGLGSDWGPTGVLLQVLAIGGLFQTLGYVYYWIFLATARMNLLLVCELVGRSVLVVLVIVGALNGLVWIAIAYATGLATIWAVTTVWGARKLGEEIGFRDLIQLATRAIGLFGLCLVCGFALSAAVVDQATDPVQLVCLAALELLIVLVAALVPAYRRDFKLSMEAIRAMRG